MGKTTQSSTAEQLKMIDALAYKLAERAAALNGSPGKDVSDLFVNSSQLAIILERLEKEASQNGWTVEAELARNLEKQISSGKRQIQSYASNSGFQLPMVYGDVLKDFERDPNAFLERYRG